MQLCESVTCAVIITELKVINHIPSTISLSSTRIRYTILPDGFLGISTVTLRLEKGSDGDQVETKLLPSSSRKPFECTVSQR
ncbi:hypothetical protein D3C80_1438310 [compost metagenome]